MNKTDDGRSSNVDPGATPQTSPAESSAPTRAPASEGDTPALHSQARVSWMSGTRDLFPQAARRFDRALQIRSFIATRKQVLRGVRLWELSAGNAEFPANVMRPWQFGLYQIFISSLPFVLSVKILDFLGLSRPGSTPYPLPDILGRLSYEKALQVWPYLTPLTGPIGLLVAAGAAAFGSLPPRERSPERFRLAVHAYVYNNAARGLLPHMLWMALWGWNQWDAVFSAEIWPLIFWMGISFCAIYQMYVTNVRVARCVLVAAGHPESVDNAPAAIRRARRSGWGRYALSLWLAFLISWFIIDSELWAQASTIGYFLARVQLWVLHFLGHSFPVPAD